MPPGHWLIAERGTVRVERYWEVYYNRDFDHTAKYFEERVSALLDESVAFHLRADVPSAATLAADSIPASSLRWRRAARRDSSASRASSSSARPTTRAATRETSRRRAAFPCTRSRSTSATSSTTSAASSTTSTIRSPARAPSPVHGLPAGEPPPKGRARRTGRRRDFGGYVRYLIAYFEQCIKAAIDGTMDNGNFVVTYESIIPNLGALKNYKPLLQEFWRDGLFEDLDRRYFRLINRAPSLGDEINWGALSEYSPFETFQAIFVATTSSESRIWTR